MKTAENKEQKDLCSELHFCHQKCPDIYKDNLQKFQFKQKLPYRELTNNERVKENEAL